MQNLEQVLKEIMEGEQSRYGEVEYKLSDEERILRINQVVDHLTKNEKLNNEEQKLISSCVFWGLYDSPIMVKHFTISFLPLISIPCVREGFLRRFDIEFVFDARISHTYVTLKDIQEFGLAHQNWVSLAIEQLDKWPLEEKNDPKYKKLLETLLLLD